MSFAAHLTAQRRLRLLQLLHATSDYGAADALLYAALPDEGLAASLDQVRGDLAWLAEQQLVDYDRARAIARLTARGIDVSLGRAEVPGVARPRPE